MKKNSVLKTSTVCEGKMDKSLATFIKNSLYKNKSAVCKTHSNTICGTISSKNIKVDKSGCCKTFYFIDKDDLEDTVIEELKKKIAEQNDSLIMSIPQMEVCLLAIFEPHHDTKLDKKRLEEKLQKHIYENKILNGKYEHSPQHLEKILNYLKTIVEDSNCEYSLVDFENNLKHYSSNNFLHTNIIEYIEYIEHLKKEKEH